MTITPATINSLTSIDAMLLGFVAGVAFASIVLTVILIAHRAARPRVEP